MLRGSASAEKNILTQEKVSKTRRFEELLRFTRRNSGNQMKEWELSGAFSAEGKSEKC
jgi:hypothetical protein